MTNLCHQLDNILQCSLLGFAWCSFNVTNTNGIQIFDFYILNSTSLILVKKKLLENTDSKSGKNFCSRIRQNFLTNLHGLCFMVSERLFRILCIKFAVLKLIFFFEEMKIYNGNENCMERKQTSLKLGL